MRTLGERLHAAGGGRVMYVHGQMVEHETHHPSGNIELRWTDGEGLEYEGYYDLSEEHPEIKVFSLSLVE